MRKLVIILLIVTVGAIASCQREGCVGYDKKTGEYRTTNKAHEKDGGVAPKNPKRAF